MNPDYDVAPNQAEGKILNQLELNEKLVEPDKATYDYINRNIQLGNVPLSEFVFEMAEHQVGKRFLEMPGNEAGYYVGYWMGKTILEMQQYRFTAGLSIQAIGRQLINSKFSKQIIKDETVQGALSSLVTKKQQ